MSRPRLDGDSVKYALRHSGWTVPEAAEYVGVRYGEFVSAIQGKTTLDPAQVARLARLTACEAVDLYEV